MFYVNRLKPEIRIRTVPDKPHGRIEQYLATEQQPNSLEYRLAMVNAISERYPECTCPADDDTAPYARIAWSYRVEMKLKQSYRVLCEHCLIVESINEIGAILDDVITEFTRREGP